MTNIQRALPGVAVEIDGAPYRLEYTMHSIAQVKKLTGRNLLVEVFDAENPEDWCLYFWSSLITHHAEFDGFVDRNGVADEAVKGGLVKAGKMLKGNNLVTILAAISEALKDATPKPSGEAKKVESQA